MKSWLIALCIVPLLAACNSVPVPAGSAVDIPADRLLAFQSPSSAADATLVVIRDVGIGHGGCYYSFYINGTFAARIDRGERATFHVPPGEVVMRVGRDPQGKALCQWKQGEWTQRETTLSAGETKQFRLSIDQSGKKDIQRADPVGAP
jgi:hypothetical protein